MLYCTPFSPTSFLLGLVGAPVLPQLCTDDASVVCPQMHRLWWHAVLVVTLPEWLGRVFVGKRTMRLAQARVAQRTQHRCTTEYSRLFNSRLRYDSFVIATSAAPPPPPLGANACPPCTLWSPLDRGASVATSCLPRDAVCTAGQNNLYYVSRERERVCMQHEACASRPPTLSCWRWPHFL